MGVRGLQSFIEHQCPDAFPTVSIAELAEQHQRKYNCIPVLAVDGMAVMNPLYSASLEWICGGQWLQFFKKLEHFIARFDSIGVKLVFFFDGTVSASKREEWVRRRLEKSQQIAGILANIKSTNRAPSKRDFQLPTSMGTLTRFAIKEIGADVYQTDREADEVIAEYARTHNEVFGILSQDSDFVIFNTKMYLSISHLDLDTLQTRHYDRQRLACQYLGLQVSQLPLFACLVGNDFVPPEKMRHFHKRLSRNGHTYLSDYAVNLAKVISMSHWMGDSHNTREMDHISEVVFGNAQWAGFFEKGLKSYVLGNMPNLPRFGVDLHPGVQRAAYERHLHCENGPFIYNLLHNLEYESSEVLEDTSRDPSALIYRRIRQRCYGILFNSFSPTSHRDPQHVKVKEWCAYRGNSMQMPEFVEPSPIKLFQTLQSQIPNIQTVWFEYSDAEKMMLFWHILQAPIKFELLLTIPKNRLVLICVLNYLIGCSDHVLLLEPLEVAVFVAQAVCRKNIDDLEALQLPLIDVAAINLSTLFMRGVTTILMILGTCGNPFSPVFAMPWHFFDGKVFHHLYTRAGRKPFIAEMCSNEDEKREFHQMLTFATNRTNYDVTKLNWRTILHDFDYGLL